MTDSSQPARPGARHRLVLVTGLSGAGHSTSLKTLEDLGHEAIDNLPIALLGPLVDHAEGRPMAVTIDTRTRGFSVEALEAEIAALRARGDVDVRLLFVDADDEVLQRRFTETRRRHPLAIDRPVADGIRRERLELYPLRLLADVVVDTSLTSPQDLRRLIEGHFGLDTAPGLYVTVMSFSFKRGLPREADLVFDVRFLDNPHWVPELRPLTGQAAAVQEMVRRDPQFDPFMASLFGLLEPLLPRYNREGKSYLTIAVGCTGGKHRSVFVAETLAAWLDGQGTRRGLVHRDMPT
ncbi:RNase adapter RapZ [Inquilinus limosus]|uniref:RNase adaptor protein RapZ n=1 Tax=Inquilinus limosus TaxID=171674 RepID=A0A211ZM60_9PROT|nr:RNase adapter RapZ [Inquilinus limosus]OWJ66349.1 RNase adaptor protein RapZ [Inquilinus limosus]